MGERRRPLHGRARGPQPSLVILDWLVPEVDGVNVCREVRSRSGGERLYISLVTSRGQQDNMVEGFDADEDHGVIGLSARRSFRSGSGWLRV